MIKQRILNKLRKALLNILLLASVSFATTSLQATENSSNYTSTYKDNKSLISDSRQVDCLAEAGYFESRGQGDRGMLATMHVIMNRVKDGNFANTPCSVIAQPKQFSYRGKGLKVKEPEVHQRALELAQEVVSGKRKDFTQGSLYFVHRKINNPWLKQVDYKCTIGDHKFFK